MNQLHYTKSGKLDMRYNSSKAYVACHPNYSPPPPYSARSASGGLHYTKSGNLDMRYNSSKAFIASQNLPMSRGYPIQTFVPSSPPPQPSRSRIPEIKESPKVPSTPPPSISKTPEKKENKTVTSPSKTKSDHYIKRTNIKESEKPTVKDRERSHIFPWELANIMLEHKRGPPIEKGSERHKKFTNAMNSKGNLRSKTRKGNRGKKGENNWKSDTHADSRIINCYNTSKPLKKFDAKRVKRQWNFIKNSEMDDIDKEFFKNEFMKFRDEEGKIVIIDYDDTKVIVSDEDDSYDSISDEDETENNSSWLSWLWSWIF